METFDIENKPILIFYCNCGNPEEYGVKVPLDGQDYSIFKKCPLCKISMYVKIPSKGWFIGSN